MWLRVWLLDGDCIDVEIADEADAVAAAGEKVGQDIGHLVAEIEWL